MLAECLPQSDITQTIIDPMVRPLITNEQYLSQQISEEKEEEEEEKKENSITPIKIPLVTSQPILATSNTYILVNEHTKRRNQFVLFDHQRQRFNIRSCIVEELLDALWYEKEQCFLILTVSNVYLLNPDTKKIDQIDEIFPTENKTFKSFTLVNSSLFIAYDEWNGESIDRWQQDENNIWKLMNIQSLKLTSNEFIGNMSTIKEENKIHLGITVYNILTEQWRMEIRNATTLLTEQKAILLAKSNIMHDYRIIPMNNAQFNIQWLAFSSANSKIVAIDSEHKKQTLNYRNPVQRMAVFNENYLIVRTRERIDIHSFV